MNRPKPKQKNGRALPRPRAVQTTLATGFPKVTTVRLKYVTDLTLSPTVGSLSTYAFRANSPFDPDFSGVGHQPLGYDQWSEFYQKYVVKTSKILIEANSQTNSAKPVVVGVLKSHVSNPAIVPSTVIEQPLARTKFLTGHVQSQRPGRIVHEFDCRQFFGVRDPNDSIDRIGGFTGGNPTEPAYFVVFAGSADTTELTPPPVSFLVTLEMDVQFSTPRNLNAS